MIINGPIAIDSLPSIPWKNGGGTTRTLVVEPEGAGLDDFLWRISLAEIHESGSFSEFPGIDRTIVLWRGQGVVLRSPAWPEHALTELYQPFRFRGEEAVTCQLTGESTADLNLMTRRNMALGSIHTHETEVSVAYLYDDMVILCASGRVHILLPDRSKIAVNTGQFLCISEMEAGVTIVPDGRATFICATVQLLGRALAR
jgi:environmental stress-induced protein Ves